MMQKVRAMLKQYPAEIHTSVEPVNDIGGNQSNADVQYYIQGPDLDQLAKYSDAMLAKMKAIPGAADPDTTLRSGKPEVRLNINRPRAADLGVSVHEYRAGAEHAGGRAGGVHIQCGRRPVRRPRARRRAVPHHIGRPRQNDRAVDQTGFAWASMKW